jgi:hypothetical protein
VTSMRFDQTIRKALGPTGLELTHPSRENLQNFASKAGNAHGAALEYFISEFRRASGNEGELLKRGLRELETQRAISTNEAAQLQLVFDAIAAARNPSDASDRIRKVQEKLKGDSKSSLAATIVADIAMDSLHHTGLNAAGGDATVRRFSDWRRVVSGDLLGALSGWMLGLALTTGNPAGGAVGAVVGAAVVSTVAAVTPN